MDNWLNTTAVVLAGGLGTRLRSVVSDRPKVLAEVHGRPFICYLLDQLTAAGVCRVVLCSGYLAEQIEQTLGGSYHGLPLAYSVESVPLGTAGALRAALPLLTTEDLLVLNGDSYFEVDWRAFNAFHRRHAGKVSLALAAVPDTQRFGRVVLTADGRITAFEEKNCAGGPGWINAGIYGLTRARLSDIPAERSVSLERECFPRWLREGLYGFAGEGRFLDIGVPDSYSQASAFFAPALEVHS